MLSLMFKAQALLYDDGFLCGCFLAIMQFSTIKYFVMFHMLSNEIWSLQAADIII